MNAQKKSPPTEVEGFFFGCMEVTCMGITYNTELRSRLSISNSI